MPHEIFDDHRLVHKFMDGLKRADTDGWRSFTSKVYQEAPMVLRDLAMQLVLDGRCLRTQRIIAESSLAFLIDSFSPLPEIDREFVKHVREAFFTDPKQRKRFLKRGQESWQKHAPEFYTSFHEYLEDACGNARPLYHELLEACWIVTLVIIQAYEDDPVHSLVNQFE